MKYALHRKRKHDAWATEILAFWLQLSCEHVQLGTWPTLNTLLISNPDIFVVIGYSKAKGFCTIIESAFPLSIRLQTSRA